MYDEFLKDYFGDKFCDKNDFSKCDRDDQWRVIYESYEVDPVSSFYIFFNLEINFYLHFFLIYYFGF